MDTNNQQFDPTSLGAKPVQGSFDPTSIGAKSYDGSQDINNTAALLGATNTANSIQRDASGKATPEQMDAFKQQDQEAMDKADQANSPISIAQETGKGVIDSLVTGGAKFIKTAVAMPIDIVRSLFGKAPISLPNSDGSNPIPTIQENAAQNTGKVFDGTMSPLAATGQAVGDTVSGAADVLGGEGLVKGFAKGASIVADSSLGQAAKTAIENQASKTAAKQSLKVVTPELTARETESALAQGRGQAGGIFKKASIAPDQNLKNVADSVKDVVSKNAPDIQNINNIKSAIGTEADSLATKVKSVKQTVSSNGVKTWLDNVEKPIEIESDATQSRKFDITKQRMMDIVKNNLQKDPTVGSLLKSRKEFDLLVQKEFPTIYDRTNAPWRSAVTGMRNAMNSAIEANLPDGLGYKESLRKQSLMYQAIDNIASKAGSEVGTSKLGRVVTAIKEHPVGAALTGAGAAEIGRKTITGRF